jgi:putative selenate reductase
MPSQYEEQDLALADGVIFDELIAPLSFKDGVLTCEYMQLGEYDDSGRRGITGTGKTTEMHFDTLIGAVGARVDTEHFTRNGIALNEKGYPRTNEANESSVTDVYIAGDCRAGAATVVKAVADGKTIAADVLQKLGLAADFAAASAGGAAEDPRSGAGAQGGRTINAAVQDEVWKQPPLLVAAREETLYAKKGVLVPACDGAADGGRCLSCAEICEICVDVCPNRANVLVLAGGAGSSAHQVVHIDRMCNECGNCAVFCPHGGMPYRDKFTVFKNGEDFADSENPGFLPLGEKLFRLRLEDKSVLDRAAGEGGVPRNYVELIGAIMKDYAYLL